MAAELIVCGEFALGVGGEFEQECARTLRDQLPDGYIVATNVHVPRGGSEFYECDAVIAAPGVCDILEMKCIRPELSVVEDSLMSSTGFCVDRVFSTVDHKAKVLASRRQLPPFPSSGSHRHVRVNSQVVVPSGTRIIYKEATHKATKPVRTLSDTVDKYRRMASEVTPFGDSIARRETRNAWMAYRDASARTRRRTQCHLGRFAIRRQLSDDRGVREYYAVDEPPVQMEVNLREFPFDPVLPASELDAYLQAVARETRTLMKVRHPYVACVVGHFQTGGSWVQVSDWFDGERLESLWPVIAEMSCWDKVGIFIKAIQALQFCHEKGVFHRNVGASAILVSQDLGEVRLAGFECALDLSSTSTMTGSVLARRDTRIVAPEDLQTGHSPNPRLSDIFQAGILLYRLLENGAWPFSDTLDYVTGNARVRPFSALPSDAETDTLQRLSVRMMDVNPSRRPDMLRRVEEELETALVGGSK